MAVDVAPELLEQIQTEFNRRIDRNQRVAEVYWKIQDGKPLTYEDANIFAEEVGNVLAQCFKKVFTPDSLPNGQLYYNIAEKVVKPMLVNNFNLISDVAEQAQLSLNKAAGINLKAKKPKINSGRIDGLAEKSASYKTIEESAWVLNEPVINYSQSVVDDFVRENVEFQYKAGFKPKITRIFHGGDCEYCAERAGTFDYPEIPDGFYRRHRECRCTILFAPEKGKFQDVWGKRSYSDANEAAIEQRKLNAKRDKMTEEEKRKARNERARQLRRQQFTEEEWAERKRKQKAIAYYKSRGN